VENVCQRLGLTSLAFLWQREQPTLLQTMIDCMMDARLVKVCSMGLDETHLGKSISQLQTHFTKLSSICGFNVCGEGGEYESAVFDCPLFKSKRIHLDRAEVVVIDANPLAPVSFLKLEKLLLAEKDEETIKQHR
jgi:diphthine-ammonia ligase